MWPIYLLIAVVEYAVTCLVVAGGVYVSISVVAGHNRLGRRLFIAVLAFGGCSAIGYVALSVLSALMHAQTQPTDEPNQLLVKVVYVGSGMLGGCASWKLFKPST